MILSRQNSLAPKVAFSVVILAALATWRRLRRLDPPPVQVAAPGVGVMVLYRTEQQQRGKGCGPLFPPLDGFGPLTPIDDRGDCFVAEPLAKRTIH